MTTPPAEFLPGIQEFLLSRCPDPVMRPEIARIALGRSLRTDVIGLLARQARAESFPPCGRVLVGCRMRLNLSPECSVYLASLQGQWLFSTKPKLRRTFYSLVRSLLQATWNDASWLSFAPASLVEQQQTWASAQRRGPVAPYPAELQRWETLARAILERLQTKPAKVLASLLADGTAVIENVSIDGDTFTVTPDYH